MTVDAEQLRLSAHQVEKWSVAWGLLSLALWGWFAYRLLMANDVAFGAGREDVIALVGILALAVIPTIIAAATIVYAQVLFRLARQAGPVGE
ncbi:MULTISPECIES: hypothetical protein [Streptomyces]|uniref:Uncharacterized protein n=2 Tax=Streptomyces TaxID=1883 RepID=A0A2U9PE09_STRAS|nr:hypothetical protein [Streptomyces actuosus]AWT47305.1 hypothetical protein DMT42_37055 [Streptomyces actuosus]MBM4823487.1 hypothetical protein [Streptomyces actuosus]